MAGKLDGKVAVITGGSSGIGLATAKIFADEGARVYIMGRRKENLTAAVERIGRNATGIQGDVTKLVDLDTLYAAVKKEVGHIDVLFANAGSGQWVSLGAITEEHVDKTFGLNVKGLLFTVQKALPLLKDGGSIVLNASSCRPSLAQAMQRCASASRWWRRRASTRPGPWISWRMPSTTAAASLPHARSKRPTLTLEAKENTDVGKL